MRLLAAAFTTRTTGSLPEPASISLAEKAQNGDIKRSRSRSQRVRVHDLVDALITIVPRVSAVVSETDRQAAAVSTISTNMIVPLYHSKIFPDNVTSGILMLWNQLALNANASKTWKKDIGEAFNHTRFFSIKMDLVQADVLPLLRQWALADRERIQDICSRITAPTSAGIMFGVGASATRMDADKKSQLNLRRLATLILASDSDFVVTSFGIIEEKVLELLTASTSSSPSSVTRAETFMLLRAIILKTSPVHLASIWSTITSELQKAIVSSLPRSKDYDTYNAASLLQACKLLELLLLTAPNEFQMHEWIFITDTIDAVYKPGSWEPVALVDDLAEELGNIGNLASPRPTPATAALNGSEFVLPLLQVNRHVADLSKDEMVMKILRPYFSQLSIHSYEAKYSLKGPDLKICEWSLIEDLFDDTTIVG